MPPAIVTMKSGAMEAQNFFKGELLNRWLRFSGVSDKSALTYKIALKQLSKFFRANAIDKPAREDLEKWRDRLLAEKKSASTIQLYLTATKIFFRWLAQENIFPNIADHLKSKIKINHDHKKDALTAAQASNLLKGVGGNSVKSKRDKAILALMMTAGLRTIEVSRADCGDMIQQFGKSYLLIQGKGHSDKDARILLPVQVETLIRDYLKTRGNVESSQPLFSSCANRSRGARLSAQAVSKMVKANLRAIGLDSPRLTAHSLRHTAATQMILSGVDLPKVQQVLRHVNINTTMIYNNAVERLKNQAEQTVANAIFANIPFRGGYQNA